MMGHTFPGILGLQQRVIPAYRAQFLDSLAQACQDGLMVFSGKPLVGEGIQPVEELGVAQPYWTRNRYLFDPGSSLFFCWQDGFIHWLERAQPQVLIVEANPRYPATRLAVAWMHRRRRKVIGWGLGAPPIRGLLAPLRTWERLNFLGSLDGVIAYSRLGAEQYRRLGLAPDRVYTAFNAADRAPTVPPPERSPRFDGKATLLFIGRLQKRKRIDLLLQACQALPAEIQPGLVIVGDGPGREEFERLSEKTYPQAEFVGEKHGAELDPYYARADLFVLPGTGGLAIQQAMAHGLPVIAAQGDGTQEDLVGSENGWLVGADDIHGLTDALMQALSNPAKLRKMGETSYRIVSEEINVEKMVQVFITACNDLHGETQKGF